VAVAAMRGGSGEAVTADQALLDPLQEAAAPHLGTWLATLRGWAEEADSLEVLRDQVLSSSGDLSPMQMAEVMGLAFSLVNAQGQEAVAQEAGWEGVEDV